MGAPPARAGGPRSGRGELRSTADRRIACPTDRLSLTGTDGELRTGHQDDLAGNTDRLSLMGTDGEGLAWRLWNPGAAASHASPPGAS